MDLNITIGGHWLSLECHYGDVELSTVWPGGSDELSFATSDLPAPLSNGGALVAAYAGPVRCFYGTLLEPDPSQDRQVAQGLWRLGDNYAALSAGAATTIPNTAIDTAIAAGIPWTRPTSIQSTAVDLDVSQGPVKVGALLDAWTEQSGQRWGVDTNGAVIAKADDTAPTYTVLPLDGGLGFALDGYASTLIGRYYNGTAYATATRTDTTAQTLHGHSETIVDLTPRGTLTSTKANTILDNLLALGRSTPQWTTTITVAYGELLTIGGVPVELETVQSGKVIRIPGSDLTRANLGTFYVDMLIGATALSEGLLTIQPMQTAARSFTDVITKALTKK